MKSGHLTAGVTMTMSGWSTAVQDAMWQTPTIHKPVSAAVPMSAGTSEAAGGSVRREAAGLDADTRATEPGREAALEAALAARASLYLR